MAVPQRSPTRDTAVQKAAKAPERVDTQHTHISRCSDVGCVSVPNPNDNPIAPIRQVSTSVPTTSMTHLSQCCTA